MKDKKTLVRSLWICLGLVGGNLLFFLTVWLANKYDDVSLDQFIYQMKSSSAGANRSIAGSAVVRVGVFGLGAAAVEILACLVSSGYFREKLKKHPLYTRFRRTWLSGLLARRAVSLTMAVLLLSVCFFTVRLDVIGYVDALTTDSSFIENNYVNPEKVELRFPEQKRNLIYIFLESMEVTFSDTKAGGPIHDNYIPELTDLAEENVNFSHTSGVGGARTYPGSTWTAAAMVSQTSGVIVQVPLKAGDFGGENEYIPGLVSIGEVLMDQGYNQTLLVGSDAEFAGRDAYFREHGNYNIVDINSLKAEGRLPEDYREWWGFEDEKLYAYAREELTKLANSGEPFNFTMLTCDSHFPDGYVCRLCGEEYEEQYPNVLRCSSRQLADFVAWIQGQPFYQNTTIVISGDHLTMDPDFLADVNEDYVRTVYNCIINPAVEPVREKNRQFGTFDMFPTTLAAMGVEIPGNRLGLGTNLFSGTRTLTETYGFERMVRELQCNSEFYNDTFLQLDGEKKAVGGR
jgi:phosphoglycerol transferase